MKVFTKTNQSLTKEFCFFFFIWTNSSLCLWAHTNSSTSCCSTPHQHSTLVKVTHPVNHLWFLTWLLCLFEVFLQLLSIKSSILHRLVDLFILRDWNFYNHHMVSDSSSIFSDHVVSDVLFTSGGVGLGVVDQNSAAHMVSLNDIVIK